MSRAGGGGWAMLRPLPSRLWVRWTPAEWPAVRGGFTDLARARLGGLAGVEGNGMPGALPEEPEVLFLPPTDSGREGERFDLAERALAAGHAVLWTRASLGAPAPRAAIEVVDLLPALLSGEWPERARLQGAAVALWPLVAGLSEPEGARSIAAGLERLVEAGVPALLGLALELDPAERRQLAELGGEELFERLFHAAPEDLRPLARAARQHGLAWGIPRPAVALRPVRARNRELAGLLAIAAERWLAAGRSESVGEELWRAAREAESFPHDLAALVREERLGLFPWLAGVARPVVEDWGANREPALLAELEREWLRTEGG